MRQTTRAGIRRVVAGVLGVTLAAAGVGVAVLDVRAADAAPSASVLDGFDPGNILDDGVMFNATTMTAGQIQTFLNEKQPSCAVGATCLKSVLVDIPAMPANLMCAAVATQLQATAAQAIAAVAKACNVNPQVILVVLQKEQTLITGRMPSASETVALIYRKATGLGCPDTSTCDPSKYGLFNQLYGAAYWLVRYTTPPGTTGPGWTSYNWFPVGRPVGVLYNPNAACGARTITIANKATASLYYYTPYVPNAAALAAGWGAGNACSAYGNRNFYLYFTTWFGSTHIPTVTVDPAVANYWAAHRDTIGDPAGPAVRVTTNGGGTYQPFTNAVIYASPAGIFDASGASLKQYTGAGGPAGPLGWPTGTANPSGSPGTVQTYQNGSIYSSPAGTAVVQASVLAKYLATGGERGPLGWPTAAAVSSRDGSGTSWQSFQTGRIVTTPTSASALAGRAFTAWAKAGYDTGALRWPTEDAHAFTAHGATGLVQRFQNGIVTVQGTARTVSGQIGANYLFHGGPAGALGWPASSAKATSGGSTQRFVNGAIFWSPATGAHALSTSATLSLYDVQRGPTGPLGWLKTSRSDRSGIGGTIAIFTGGRIYSSTAVTAAVTGPILSRYLAKGGPSGVLGWPTTAPTQQRNITVQRFQHGRITWSAAAGAKASRS